MMYYIIKENNIYRVHDVADATDGTYHDLQDLGYELYGQFGKEDYAQNHVDYYNKKITKEKFNSLMNF